MVWSQDSSLCCPSRYPPTKKTMLYLTMAAFFLSLPSFWGWLFDDPRLDQSIAEPLQSVNHLAFSPQTLGQTSKTLDILSHHLRFGIWIPTTYPKHRTSGGIWMPKERDKHLGWNFLQMLFDIVSGWNLKFPIVSGVVMWKFMIIHPASVLYALLVHMFHHKRVCLWS